MKRLRNLIRDNSGATAIEYELIAAATGLALIAVMPLVKTQLSAVFTSISAGLAAATGG